MVQSPKHLLLPDIQIMLEMNGMVTGEAMAVVEATGNSTANTCSLVQCLTWLHFLHTGITTWITDRTIVEADHIMVVQELVAECLEPIVLILKKPDLIPGGAKAQTEVLSNRDLIKQQDRVPDIALVFHPVQEVVDLVNRYTRKYLSPDFFGLT